MKNLNALDWVAMILLVIGGINWGLIGLFAFDLVAVLFGAGTFLANTVYTLVGLSALYVAFLTPSFRKRQMGTEARV